MASIFLPGATAKIRLTILQLNKDSNLTMLMTTENAGVVLPVVGDMVESPKQESFVVIQRIIRYIPTGDVEIDCIVTTLDLINPKADGGVPNAK